jgi:ParB family chromosome partitioning protein
VLARALLAAERRTATEWAATPAPKRAPVARAWERLLWAGSRLGLTELAGVARELLLGGEARAPAGVRQEAARVLGRLGTSDVEPLRAALADPDARVRAGAAATLAQLAPEHAGAWALAVKPFDPVALGPTGAVVRGADTLASSEARRVALPSLLAGRQVEPLRPLATHARNEVRQDAFAALGRVGTDSAAEVLRTLAFDKSQPVELRKAAYRAHKRARRAAERARAQKEGTPS